MTHRRFPPPWSVEDVGAAFVVRDSTGQQLAYVYFVDERADDRPPSCWWRIPPNRNKYCEAARAFERPVT
jgi:hypothetical protein